MATFIHWYNHEHLHSALGYVTPAQRRGGEDQALFQLRNETITAAKSRHPERWGARKQRVWIADHVVLLNPEKEEKSA